MLATTTAPKVFELESAGTSRPAARSRRALALAAAFAIAATVAAPAMAGSMSMSKSELQQFGRQLQLTGEQTPTVNAITLNLVRENAAIFARYGIDGQSCSDLRPLQLSALNNETMAAYKRAKSQLSQVLSPAQLQRYGAIYNQRRQETKSRIVCNARAAQR